MVGYHCGERVQWISDNPVYFRVKCQVCNKIFVQRKRKSRKPLSRQLMEDKVIWEDFVSAKDALLKASLAIAKNKEEQAATTRIFHEIQAGSNILQLKTQLLEMVSYIQAQLRSNN